MVTRGFWNVQSRGKWYQIHHAGIGRISSPGDPLTYLTLQSLKEAHLKDDIINLKGGRGGAVPVRIPFPFPLKGNLDYVYTLDLDVELDPGGDLGSGGELMVSFWHREDGYHEPASIPSGDDSLPGGTTYDFEHLQIKPTQPTPMNELQQRMFTDLIYQWRFFIDEHSVTPSPLLNQRLIIALLRIAAWDFNIFSDKECVNAVAAKLPLRAESFPAWGSPVGDVYWFHGFVVVVCAGGNLDLKDESWIERAHGKVGEFVGVGAGGAERMGKVVDCILISVAEDDDRVYVSDIFSLVTDSSAVECSAGFRALVWLLTSCHGVRGDGKLDGFSLAAREYSILNTMPIELLTMVLEAVEPYDIISFAKASFVVEKWYYSSSSVFVSQLPGLVVHQHEASIKCCGRRRTDGGEGEKGLCCSECYAWQHLSCLNRHPNENYLKEHFICSQFLPVTSTHPPTPTQKPISRTRLTPGRIGRANRRVCRGDGCGVMKDKQQRILQLRITSPAVLRPEVWLMDRELRNTLPNEIDYVVLFGGVWSGLAYGVDGVRAG
ncbi:hypothetical protein BKA65DRAFT_536731 [Rhexocercosporidium sp. MPI-PUGE-AT-0058]|nr:hypothetical protein BKA65DRAFT_536731 [Rhexocercosporidium sp. MPI-PUGE-AT-0058]